METKKRQPQHLTRGRFLSTMALATMGVLMLSGCGGGGAGSTPATKKVVFRYTGSEQSFVVPAGVTAIDVKLWGAGGGQNGGSGAFVSGRLAVTPGETLTLYVGQGGQVAGLGVLTTIAYGNGGIGTGDASFKGGGGGGLTRIQRTPFTSFDDFRVIAGAGGGGQFWGGGGGGIATGLKGNGNNGAGGEGGTQTAGGAAGGGTRTGTAGERSRGGDGKGDSSASSGGGGSGHFGGAGGGKNSNNGGGGGGSSLVVNLTNLVSEAGKNGNNNTSLAVVTTTPVTPGGATDPDYIAGVGQGGANDQVGGNGLIVISYPE